MTCERCKKNPGLVPVEQYINGRRERQYLCESCVDELLRSLGPFFGLDVPGNGNTPFPSPFPLAESPFAPPLLRGSGQGRPARTSSTPTVDQYSRDLTAEADRGELDLATGRSRELRRLITILGRRGKNNPVLIGEPGVGKTAIVEGLAQHIHAGTVPPFLRGRRIVSLNVGALVAGAMLRGQFEQRIRTIIDELRWAPEVIIFIDEIHVIANTGGDGAIGADELFKPALARGELRCIGATTTNDYRKYIEKDAALERRFQPILVEEPSVESALEMLHAARPKYERHHGVSISDEALLAAVTLSSRYISDRWLPDKAIDVLDEAGSALRLEAAERGEVSPQMRGDLERALADILRKKEAAATSEDYERAASMRQAELQLMQQLERALSPSGAVTSLVMTPEHIANAVENWTGIPVGRLLERERSHLLQLETSLSRHVIGQDEAIRIVSRAIRRSRVGMRDPRRPIGSFLFLGPTGVGKTELAKALAAELFGNQDAMIRLDMSEYMEPHAVARLFGSPPGYVGYDEGGQLTEQVRRRPHRVILCDEIEKAHPQVFNALLQIMDDGRLTDGQGRLVDFKNVIIVMTSNAGDVDPGRLGRVGFLGQEKGQARHEALRERAREGMKRLFRPEFINRLDQVAFFLPLDEQAARQIIDLQLDQVRERVHEQGIELFVSGEVCDLLLREGFDENHGARPLRRAIQAHVEDTLTDDYLSGKLQRGATAHLYVRDGAVRISVQGHLPHLE